jgi:IS4 transposase
VVTQIPVSFYRTKAAVHDVNAMDWINYEPFACYIFDRGYWDLNRLYRIELLNSFFVIREKRRPKFEVLDGEDLLEGPDNILRDGTVRFTTKGNTENYPAEIRRIVYYEPKLKRTFTYYTNNFYLKAREIAFLYKNRWVVESFFKWMKGNLRIKSFWGTTENAVRIQIYVAMCTYCLVAIVQKDMQLDRSAYEVLQILSISLTDKTHLRDLWLCKLNCVRF